MSELGDEIAATEDREREECSAWGHDFWIQELTPADCDYLDKTKVSEVMKLAMVVVRGACDQNGERLFKDPNAQGLSARKSAQSLQRVADKILDLSGLTIEAREAQAKNSETTSRPECGTASPSGSTSPTSPDSNGK